MMVAAAEGSTNLDLSVRETKSKILMLLEQKIYQVRATQENIDQLVIISPSVGSKMVISGTTSSQSPGLISKGHDTTGSCNSGRSGRGTSSSRASAIHCQVFPSLAICSLSSSNKYLSGYKISVFVLQSDWKAPRPPARH